MKRLLVLLTPALALGSCGPGGGVVAGGQDALSGADSAGYLDHISSQPTVTEAQAAEGVLLLLGQEPEATFAEAVKFLTERKIADPGWGFQADRAISRGRVAYMIYQACNMKGGLTLLLTGPSQRYCLRELQYLGFMTTGPTYNKVTGMEYVAILARADELRQTGKVSAVMTKEESLE